MKALSEERNFLIRKSAITQEISYFIGNLLVAKKNMASYHTGNLTIQRVREEILKNIFSLLVTSLSIIYYSPPFSLYSSSFQSNILLDKSSVNRLTCPY